MGMLRETLTDFNECGLPSALEVMGERWSFMILRAALNGVHHFEEFQTELGIARNILSNRLQRLVAHGILARDVMCCDRRKVQYRLTEKGTDLLPTMVALRQWGEKWGLGTPSTPVLADARDLQPIRPVALQAHDGRVLGKHDLCWIDVGEMREVRQIGAASAHVSPAAPASISAAIAGDAKGAAPALAPTKQ
jgi:DNA-binding HxlR family transcriptional regulator